MTAEEIEKAKCDIEATADLLERAMKLSGLLTTLFQERGFPLVVVGGGAVEFYTEGGYMSGNIDFCRKTLKAVPPELALVERVLYAEQDAGCVASARQMMASALADTSFDWFEAERLAALPDFRVADRLALLKREIANA